MFGGAAVVRKWSGEMYDPETASRSVETSCRPKVLQLCTHKGVMHEYNWYTFSVFVHAFVVRNEK